MALGFEPALVVQTSPGNLQAWLSHGRTLPKVVSTAAARALAERWGGDKGAADWRHFGRLSGFTNKKRKYQLENGLYPFVRLIEAAGAVYSSAREFIPHIEDRVATEERDRTGLRSPLLREYRHHRNRTIDDFRANPAYNGDGNRIDLAYAVYALSHGVPEASVRAAIASRDLSKKGSAARQLGYVERTIQKARRGLADRNAVPDRA